MTDDKNPQHDEIARILSEDPNATVIQSDTTELWVLNGNQAKLGRELVAQKKRLKHRRFIVEEQIGGTWARVSELRVMVRADAESWALRLSDRGRVTRVRELDLQSRTTTFDEAEREALADEELAGEHGHERLDEEP